MPNLKPTPNPNPNSNPNPILLYNTGIIKAKRDGEIEVMKLYEDLGPKSPLSYTIIRPGRLTNSPPVGCEGDTNTELSQSFKS
jgi:hypothetical protein